MTKKIKYITIGRPVDYDAIHNLPESEKTSEKVLSLKATLQGLYQLVDSQALTNDHTTEREVRVSLKEVEDFVKGSDFVLIVTSVGFTPECKAAVEIIKLVKDTGISFHVIQARPFDFASTEEAVNAHEVEAAAITDKITKTDLYYNAMARFSPDTSTKEAFKQIGKDLYSLMQGIIEKI